MFRSTSKSIKENFITYLWDRKFNIHNLCNFYTNKFMFIYYPEENLGNEMNFTFNEFIILNSKLYR